MIDRRHLLLGLAMLAAAPLHAQAPASDPVGMMTAIYTRVAKGKGEDGGNFVIETKKARATYLSTSLAAQWAKMDARTPKGEVGAVDFDPITNSQDPDVASFKVTPEKQEADKATLAVTITGHRNERKEQADSVIRYDLVREAGQWKIDDIRGAVDGQPWSIRTMLVEFIKLTDKPKRK
ncbi:hypothetical protein SSBR45G_09470 [Bradyrhizobium sp. SSBR45G]|uniref:DUF3828 domain-containing protein n=1 Tax=unclassified Bradyrhizobium TaxID=2631580 RepID=UPI00234299E7|nr:MULTISPECIES: DUF3828 domain-containing protein [unclassified Bradyrhizobium]GLH76039.1 hypothetical protein SSBR45G_09470 [Bradyrhizobium sp. SSBR45G]GLH89186.1 hypothetical protein SSBR45R_66470 [Bradyrhizobium sp. SSBR45R]